MVLLKISALMTMLATSTYYTAFASPLDPNAPLANDLGGVHLLLENDVDSNTPKYPVILLSKSRTYGDSQTACESLRESLVAPTFGNLTSLLNNTPVAHEELRGSTFFWTKGDDKNNGSTCFAFNRKSGQTVKRSCNENLPSLCTNSMPRYIVHEANTTSQIKVKTTHFGVWQGYRDLNQFRFLGIPYAEPPVGNLRFLKPVPINASKFVGGNKVNNATQFGNVCMQLNYGGQEVPPEYEPQVLGASSSEDCLYLNVFTPSLKASKGIRGLPVMVYVHGGSFTTYSGSTPVFEPGNLVSRGGVVVVTLNYRLGVFGLFLDTPDISESIAPGNLATRDQIQALKWVQQNIASFGGDPHQVTIFGESAGAWSMRALLSIPSAFGLYHNVISQSDLMGLPFSSQKYSTDLTSLTMKSLGCNNADLACAQNKTASDLHTAEINGINAFLNMTQYYWVSFGAVYMPMADGSLIANDFSELIKSGRYNKKANILWGFMHDEGFASITDYYPDPISVDDFNNSHVGEWRDSHVRSLLNSPYKLNTSDPDTLRIEMATATTDYYFGCPLLKMSQCIAGKSSSVYAYRMNHGRSIGSAFGGNVTSVCANRACHADDNIPTFGSGDVIPGAIQTGDDARFSRQIIDRWSTFAKTGNPNPKKNSKGLASSNPDVMNVNWPQYDDTTKPLLEIELQNTSVSHNTESAKCKWIEDNIKYEYQLNPPF
ncbi:hypothetical protein BGZ80_003566 [Entomortierella chlamydospora]|uniref:Carboxylesterase type B domain-containing protein n=1 Tax=Entomortierella chlamydospora TaxID=101097 RepID=A0A9P6T2U5_9FUNG|nr:hypothetical protein BGZ79_006739 [Entomortierella chlamydospora]KAG0020808.1 hypothetical protein BGZ80_003566 [Entomortierella chlamydospora]